MRVSFAGGTARPVKCVGALGNRWRDYRQPGPYLKPRGKFHEHAIVGVGAVRHFLLGNAGGGGGHGPSGNASGLGAGRRVFGGGARLRCPSPPVRAAPRARAPGCTRTLAGPAPRPVGPVLFSRVLFRGDSPRSHRRGDADQLPCGRFWSFSWPGLFFESPSARELRPARCSGRRGRPWLPEGRGRLSRRAIFWATPSRWGARWPGRAIRLCSENGAVAGRFCSPPR